MRASTLLTACLITACGAFSTPVWLSDCEGHGFQPGRLPCSTCAALQDRAFPGDAHPIVDACLSCCSPSLDYEGRRFDGAVLRVCRAQATGGVAEWLEKRAEAWAARGVAVENTCAGLAGLGNFGGSMGAFAGMPGMGGLSAASEPPTLVLLSEGAAAARPAAAAAARPAAKAKAKRPAAPTAAAAAAEPAAPGAEPAAPPAKGVEVGVQAFKVEHIDAFLEKHLAAGLPA